MELTGEEIHEMFRYVQEKADENFTALSKLCMEKVDIGPDGKVTGPYASSDIYEVLIRLGRQEVLEQWVNHMFRLGERFGIEQGLL